MSEPILSQDDVDAWDVWMRTALVHSRTRAHARRVDSARRVVEQALASAERPMVAWSGGKDSTVLAHLVVVDRGARHVPLVSEKDDLDFPDEEDYVQGLAVAWGAEIRVVRPPISPAQYVQEHAATMTVGDDIHGRSAGLSKACFYGVMREAGRGHDLLFLGLRAEESGVRRLSRQSKGLLYEPKATPGQLRSTPIADFRGIDVYAYLAARDVPLLSMYRCIGLMHTDEPWRLRKSWWLPGAGTAYGQVAWLRRYYPSLYERLCSWLPDATLHR